MDQLYMMQQRRVRTSFRPARSAGGSTGQEGTVTGKEADCLRHIFDEFLMDTSSQKRGDQDIKCARIDLQDRDCKSRGSASPVIFLIMTPLWLAGNGVRVALATYRDWGWY